ncbi:MAG: type II toxin-antitoxin system MqsA family antitoxin [Bacillota bacterium]
MEELNQACPICGGDTHPDVVKMSLWRFDRLVIIEDVPAFICERCGEQYYNEETETKISELSVRRFPSDMQIRVEKVPVFTLKNVEILERAEEKS